ncbi:nucleotide-binding alpha-beta plait domain-containing protein, partial [Tanacetum coccineum]
SIPTPPPPTPPPPPINRQRPTNLRQNPKQRVPYNPSVNHATVLPTTITEPTSFIVANKTPEWRQAMKEEYDALMKNEMWSLVPRASNTNVVDGNNKGTIDNIICQLRSVFALKDLGTLNYFLGIEIVSHVSDILLSQKKYILEILQSAGLSNCNPVSSPMVTSSSLTFAINEVIQILLLKLSKMLIRLEIQMIDGPRRFSVAKRSPVGRRREKADVPGKMGIRLAMILAVYNHWFHKLAIDVVIVRILCTVHTKAIQEMSAMHIGVGVMRIEEIDVMVLYGAWRRF